MTTPPGSHIPVLPQEVLRALAPGAGQTYLDCTAGLGGHARLVVPALVPGGCIVLNDADPGNLERAGAAVRSAGAEATPDERSRPGVRCIAGNFAFVPRQLPGMGLAADMVLADLGFSSNQMEDGQRGLSFMREGPLDMRLDPTLRSTAADLVNGLPEAELARIIGEFGDERHASRIARKLAQARQQGPISTTGKLAELVRSVVPGLHTGIDPATRTFQALRIAVNDELGSLESLASDVVRVSEEIVAGGSEGGTDGRWLRPGARVAIISFHSLEDRIVKGMVARVVGLGGRDVAGGAVTPGEDEQAANPRSRSAKLRCVQVPLGPGGQGRGRR